MKLVRFGKQGEEQPGIVDDHGNIRSLIQHISDFDPSTLSRTDFLQHLKTVPLDELPIINKNIRIGPCIDKPGKVICVGYNSKLHTQQMGVNPLSVTEMLVFMKPTCAVCGPTDPVWHTRHTKKLDWEAELGIVIGKRGKYIEKDKAHEYILGYTCVNDFSERYLQLETEDKQYTKGKCFDNAAPIGPYLVTKDEIPDSSNLQVQLFVNGDLRQDFMTSDYIHNDEEVVSYLSQYFTLYPGDIISMGSGPGNAKFWGNKFLQPGDTVVFSITGLGQQEHQVLVEELP